MVKVVNINREMKKFLRENGYEDGSAGRMVSVCNALDPTSFDYMVPECAEHIINQLEADGWRFEKEIHGAGLVFRNVANLRATVQDLENQGKI